MGKLLHSFGVYDALQFILSAQRSITTACYCKEFVEKLGNEIEEEHADWLGNWEWQPLEGNKKVFKLKADGFPSYTMDIAGVEISKFFFRDMMIKDFFQYSRNAFDMMAQAANAACLAFKAKRIESTDFPKMAEVFQQQTYSSAFPTMSGWFSRVNSSQEYKYLDMFCNRTKHTTEVRTNTPLSIIGDRIEPTINPFARSTQNGLVQNERKEIPAEIATLYKFVSESYSEFVDAVKHEIQQRTFVGDRYYTVNVYQQKLKDAPDNGYSIVYIDAVTTAENMPDEIQVLLVAEIHDGDKVQEIQAKNAPFKTIYIKDPTKDHTYLGKYVSEDDIGEDELLRFRKYSKVLNQQGDYPLVFQAMIDPQNKGVFYHSNPFMNITMISDDDDFIKRVSLPF